MCSQNDIYPTTTTEIHDHIADLETCETSGVATTTGKIESNLWDRGKRFLAIEPLVNSITRTGLLLARSAGFLVATCFSKFAVAAFHYLSDVLGLHLSDSCGYCHEQRH
ncbi:MAG: hypothetical protein JRJ14_09000 [Deltaproteobacteria bacterium]|nr:hypothetical protein [Deltaproteobacteria bacterium]